MQWYLPSVRSVVVCLGGLVAFKLLFPMPVSIFSVAWGITQCFKPQKRSMKFPQPQKRSMKLSLRNGKVRKNHLSLGRRNLGKDAVVPSEIKNVTVCHIGKGKHYLPHRLFLTPKFNIHFRIFSWHIYSNKGIVKHMAILG